MRNVTLTQAGPSLCCGAVDDGAVVSVVLADGAVLEISRNLRDWQTIASVSGDVTISTSDGGRGVLRFNLPVYPGHPVPVSVSEAG
jgi:hypothetical protein